MLTVEKRNCAHCWSKPGQRERGKMNDIATEKKLTPAQRKAIETLLTEGSVAAAALTAGVARSTLYRWMSDDAFLVELRAAETLAVQSLSRSLTGLGESAVTALKDALAPGNKTSTRLRAAEIVIGNLLRLRELVDLETRITALERGNP